VIPAGYQLARSGAEERFVPIERFIPVDQFSAVEVRPGGIRCEAARFVTHSEVC
jgi:hypothetical protein